MATALIPPRPMMPTGGYVIHSGEEDLPSVDAGWSITMDDAVGL